MPSINPNLLQQLQQGPTYQTMGGSSGDWFEQNAPAATTQGGGFWNPYAPKLQPDGTYTTPDPSLRLAGQVQQQGQPVPAATTQGGSVLNPANRMQPSPTASAPAGSSQFTGSSGYQALVDALNQANAAPGTPEFDRIVQAYTSALGLTGGPGNGFNWGQYDPGRTKVYVPGADLRWTNSVNGQQVNGWMAHPTGGAGIASGGGGTLAGFGGSPEEIMKQDPGYQFRLGEGLKALQSSAAARGTLLTGGTLKALNRYGQDFASGEFGNIFSRNLSLANLGKPT